MKRTQSVPERGPRRADSPGDWRASQGPIGEARLVEGPAPNQRTFSLNSDEAHAAICPRRDRPWIVAGSLPREPRVWGREVAVEKRERIG